MNNKRVILLVVFLLAAGCDKKAVTTTTVFTPEITETTAAPPTEIKVGETFSLTNGDKVTVKEVIPNAQGGTEGKHFAAVHVNYCVGSVKDNPDSEWFTLIMTDGSSLTPSIIDVRQPNLLGRRLNAGECADGWASYLIPDSGTIRSIEYSGTLDEDVDPPIHWTI